MHTFETHPFAALFGVDESVAAQALSEAMCRGAEFADLYFQHVRTTSLSLEDGIVSSANTGVDQGVGIRAVIGDQVGYAFSERLEADAIYAAARTAAAIAERAQKMCRRNTCRAERLTITTRLTATGMRSRLPNACHWCKVQRR